MDFFEIPDDYKPEKPLTDQQMDEITDYLKNHPLFMKNLPQNIEGNEHLVALQSLAEDQDPIEYANNLCNQANNKFKEKPNSIYHMKDAYNKYSEGIAVKCQSPQVNAKLHCNRAAINLKLKNYGKVITDCQKCLQYDSNYVKAYYRCAKAYLALKKYQETIKLLQNRTQNQLKELYKQAKNLLNLENQKLTQKKQQKQLISKEIQEYCLKKKWKLMKRDRRQELPPHVKMQLIDSKLSLPLIVIYPEFGQFDLIESTFQDQKLKAHLNELFQNPLPWDKKHQYNLQSIEIFCEIMPEKMMKIPKQCSISQIACRVPIRQCLQINIVRPNNQFYEYFRKTNTFIE